MLKTASTSTGRGSPGNVTVQNNGTVVATQPTINFIPGTFVTLGITNDATNQRSNVTINATTTNLGSTPYSYAWFLS